MPDLDAENGPKSALPGNAKIGAKLGFDRPIVSPVVSPSAIKRFKGPAVTENFIIVGGAL